MAGGIAQTQRETLLAATLPNGTARYVGLFATLPDADGTGGVEAVNDTTNGYARKSYSAWVNATADGQTARKNDGAIEFAALTGAFADGATGPIVGWGIWDASTSGNLLAFGPVLDVDGDETELILVAGDQVRFLDQQLQVIL